MEGIDMHFTRFEGYYIIQIKLTEGTQLGLKDHFVSLRAGLNCVLAGGLKCTWTETVFSLHLLLGPVISLVYNCEVFPFKALLLKHQIICQTHYDL